ncbi:MAG TPA: NAD(P)/FAD-dependent oxidoreductase [Hyphomicrobiaceae bacterium]|nr:NAD(P)/FAD-dependent oxidoreductase [Hyphomicrobiaceae bacterium]
MAADIECIVIGAGVVGLAIAHALAAAGRQVMVIEQHGQVGAETSSRNSEVIHAGLYYPPGSLKARLCIEGKHLLYRFAADNGVATKRLGKLLIATAPTQIPKLEAIAANARANGIDDLNALAPVDARALEPELICQGAYLSPSTGIIDTHGVMQALEGHIQANGGEVVLSTSVTQVMRDADGYRVVLASGNASSSANAADGAMESLTCDTLILAAGLHTSSLATPLFAGLPASDRRAGYVPPTTYFSKGHYFSLTGRAPFSHLIYPMPSDGGLGVHLTLDMAGDAKFGPDATWVDHISYSFDDAEGARRSAFIKEITRWWPGLNGDALQPGYTGVRPKLSRAGEPAADFAIHGPKQHGLERLVALYGIESPGLTAALAIARHVAAHLA